MDAFKLIISTRLKGSQVAGVLEELGTEVKYVTLRRGDFVLADQFGVLYISKNDFVDRIKKRTIYRDILEFKREFASPVVIIEGEDPFHDASLDLATVQGVVLFASVLNRVPILTTKNDVETAQMLFMIAAQAGSGLMWQRVMPTKEDNVLNPPPVPPTVPGDNGNGNGHGDPRVSIIANLPEVGPSLAEGLLHYFGSLSKLFAADIKTLRKVEGIGPKRAERIFAFLNGSEAA
jgi:DNA excision repair protein ERCC-4